MNWIDLYRQALRSGDAAAGYYNRNIGVRTPEGRVNVRIPIEAADTMDVRVWREEEVLACISPYVGHAPELRHTCGDPRFQVHRFIEGRVLDGFSPRGSAVPDHVLGDVVGLMEQLARIPRERAPALPGDWPESGDSPGFGRRLARLTQQVYDAHKETYGAVFAAFGIPSAPLAVVEPLWEGLASRPFAVLHADLHRKNMIVAQGATWFLDWELALWGDPVYEIGIHFHKMDYPAAQRAEVLRQWRSRMPGPYTRGLAADLDLYVAHERIKSAIVDTIRYSKQLAGTDQAGRDFLIGRLARKVNAAREVWGMPPDVAPRLVTRALAAW
ncbi:phosphotransferase family protein [Streptomyces toxytricini]|uniref:Phosphotransferase family protein n=1 Tax=Streptomyces toxytricini TaxID=67369 RepID=A0ABW8EH02_STRT5